MQYKQMGNTYMIRIDLGEDNTFTFTETGDLQGETDRTWLSIDSQPVAYYHLNTVRTGEESGIRVLNEPGGELLVFPHNSRKKGKTIKN